MHCLRSSINFFKEKEKRMSVRIPDSEVLNKNETKREGEKGEHISVRIFRILKKMCWCACLVLNSSCLSIPKVRSCRRLRTAAIAANSESSPAEPHSYGETFDIISFDRKWKHFQKWRVHGISVFRVQWSPEITKFHMIEYLRWLMNIWD